MWHVFTYLFPHFAMLQPHSDKLGTPIFRQVFPIQVGWGALVHIYFHISPEMFNLSSSLGSSWANQSIHLSLNPD